jgi:hypothetical protein
MSEKTLSQLAQALESGEISHVEYETATVAMRQKNRAKQKKYRERIKNRDSAMKLVSIAIPEAIMDGLTKLSESSGVSKRTLVELALTQFLESRGERL